MSETLEHEDHDLGDDGANAFFTNLTGETVTEKPEAGQKVGHEEPIEGEESEQDEDVEPSEKPAKEETTEADPDDAEVDVKVGDTEQKARLRDLKAAYAKQQETTTRELDVTARSTKLAADEARTSAALTKIVGDAKARWEPYAKLDFLALSRDPSIDQATFQQLRADAQAALTDFKYYTEELDGQVATQRQAAQASTAAVAQATAAALSNPTTGIKDWNQQTYNELLTYAEANGAPRGHAQTMVAEWALRALHKAMLYDKGVKATATKIEKVIAKPTRVLASGTTGSSSSTKADGLKTAMARLKSSGTTDDAADAFFASAGGDED